MKSSGKITSREMKSSGKITSREMKSRGMRRRE